MTIVLYRVKIVKRESDYFTKPKYSPITDLWLGSLCNFTTDSQFYAPLRMLIYTTIFSLQTVFGEKYVRCEF